MKISEFYTREYWANRLKKAEELGWIPYSVSVIEMTPMEFRNIEIHHQNLIRMIVPSECRVLDAGCGYGRLSSMFENYLGIDSSPELIKKAKELYPLKEFIDGDINDLPFKDKTFEWVICASVHELFNELYEQDEEWKKMESELLRIADKVLLLEYFNPSNYRIIDSSTVTAYKERDKRKDFVKEVSLETIDIQNKMKLEKKPAKEVTKEKDLPEPADMMKNVPLSEEVISN